MKIGIKKEHVLPINREKASEKFLDTFKKVHHIINETFDFTVVFIIQKNKHVNLL